MAIFATRLLNGRFDVGTFQFRFEGPVTGTYDARGEAFRGEWATSEIVTGALLGSGLWDAVHVPGTDREGLAPDAGRGGG